MPCQALAGAAALCVGTMFAPSFSLVRPWSAWVLDGKMPLVVCGTMEPPSNIPHLKRADGLAVQASPWIPYPAPPWAGYFFILFAARFRERSNSIFKNKHAPNPTPKASPISP